MKNKQKKMGISLIVLVITILVMIILATAVILTLQDSEILPGANSAKSSSDFATLKEAANTAYSSWQIAKARGKKELGDAQTYVENALKKQGLDTEYVMVKDDKLLVGAGVKLYKQNGNVDPIGAEVIGYKVESNTYSENLTGKGAKYVDVDDNTISSMKSRMDLAWSYIGMDEMGNMLIAQNIPSSDDNMECIDFAGKEGWKNAEYLLNDICNKLYSTDKGTARNMNIEDVEKIMGITIQKGCFYKDDSTYTDRIMTVGELQKLYPQYDLNDEYLPDNISDIKQIPSSSISLSLWKIKGEKNIDLIFPKDENVFYWLATVFTEAVFSNSELCVSFKIASVVSSFVSMDSMFYSNGTEKSEYYAIRPVVTIKSDIDFTFSNNTINLK